ncbi:MAG: bifunctional diaminohydroxyphosphoribosylaminopyrimidine deaminase/5-amino-6-(5-phosphoribosylamino)uracil reductase RibD [Bacteroidetes bacterium]|nr:bifunctional diaminohydroxyphosphoribosylaminopyrimidine deaminase/5-amino-6-(5-phosphoribosylamino)uracil reductase RibD [Bacteroidota bacterium]
MQRCLDLAQRASGNVAPNPLVGAVLVHNNRIIGEGYHRQYGQAHAEVNCIASVAADQQHLVKESTLYVSLEPCNHYGKTPPCTELIIQQKIPRVVIACTDPFEKVNGTGIEKLKAAGIDVQVQVMEKEAAWLNRRFFTFHTKQRPYIILKWAQSNNAMIAGPNYRSVKISNEITDRLVHKWRSEEAAIMVGTNTALYDDPSLTTRLWPGRNPVRVVLDAALKLPSSLNIFNEAAPTIILNTIRESQEANIHYIKYDGANTIPVELSKALYKLKINSVIIEGGTKLINSYIEEGLWDEARMIVNREMLITDGIKAPVIDSAALLKKDQLLTDDIYYYSKYEY